MRFLELKLRDSFLNKARETNRKFLIAKIIENNYISEDLLINKYKKTIDMYWANMMTEKAVNAIKNI